MRQKGCLLQGPQPSLGQPAGKGMASRPTKHRRMQRQPLPVRRPSSSAGQQHQYVSPLCSATTDCRLTTYGSAGLGSRPCCRGLATTFQVDSLGLPVHHSTQVPTLTWLYVHRGHQPPQRILTADEWGAIIPPDRGIMAMLMCQSSGAALQALRLSWKGSCRAWRVPQTHLV